MRQLSNYLQLPWPGRLVQIGLIGLMLILFASCVYVPPGQDFVTSGHMGYCNDNRNILCKMSIETVHGTVVDSRSGEPLEGVLIMGYWPKMMTSPHWRATVGAAHLAETSSDASGRFEIPACKPPCKVDGFFAYYQPDILFFKAGYYPKALSNPISEVHYDPRSSEHILWRWGWNGKTIELEPVSDENDPRLEAAYSLSPRLYLNDNCNWMKIPKTLMFKAQQMQLRERDKEKTAMPVPEYLTGLYLEKQKKCHPDPASYLKEAVRYE
ncbi:MAG: hypothetical protein ABW141_19375 [Candidatus Thiodiazotropha endolucinida]|nr:carboxypeptidase-like regulatory domain-containing protein [Candidatus Thiodiazotropha sp. (ex Lucina pensylvanica)]